MSKDTLKARIAAAKAKALGQYEAESSTGPGQPLGLPAGWHAIAIPADTPDARKRGMRIRLEQSGYQLSDLVPECQETVFPHLSGAEVWVIPQEAYDAVFELKQRKLHDKLDDLRGARRRNRSAKRALAATH